MSNPTSAISDREISRALNSLDDHFQRVEAKMDAIADVQAQQATALATLAERSQNDRERYYELRDTMNQIMGTIQAEQMSLRAVLTDKADKDVEEDVDAIKKSINMAKGAAIVGGTAGSAGLLSSIAQFFQSH